MRKMLKESSLCIITNYDVLVVAFSITNYDVHYVLVNNESSTDVLFYNAFSKISLTLDWLGKLNLLLVGFLGMPYPLKR